MCGIVAILILEETQFTTQKTALPVIGVIKDRDKGYISDDKYPFHPNINR
jgi:hypothetical protein